MKNKKVTVRRSYREYRTSRSLDEKATIDDDDTFKLIPPCSRECSRVIIFDRWSFALIASSKTLRVFLLKRYERSTLQYPFVEGTSRDTF